MHTCIEQLDAEIAAYELQMYELKKARDEQLGRIKKTQSTDEINKIFDTLLANLTMSKNYQTHFYLRELDKLCPSLQTFKKQLLDELETNNNDFPVKTARKLQAAINAALDPNLTVSDKDKAVNQFRDTARNSCFSHETKVEIATLVGAIIALALWVGLTLATGGTAAMLTFAGIGFGVLIVSFGAVHFGTRCDSLLRNSNPYETRGKEVSDGLKALIRARNELHAPTYQRPRDKPYDSQKNRCN